MRVPRIVCTFSLTICGAVLPAGEAGGQNIVRNHDFELGTVEWNRSSNRVVVRDGLEDTGLALFLAEDGGVAWQEYDTSNGLVPGARFWLEFEAQTGDPAVLGMLGVDFFDALGNLLPGHEGDTVFSQWYGGHGHHFLTVPAQAATATLWIWKDLGGSWLTVDSISFGPTTRSPTVIEDPEKIGIGASKDDPANDTNQISALGVASFYNWVPEGPAEYTGPAEFVPMIWDEYFVSVDHLRAARNQASPYLLGFNEPDHGGQADLGVSRAAQLWPALEATGKILGSPATAGDVLGAGTWQDRFMGAVENHGLRVDFMAIHYYVEDPSVADFKGYLEEVHRKYRRPIWVTEWALADWQDLGRHSAAEQAAWFTDAAHMLDDLPFVERHHWFQSWPRSDWNMFALEDDGPLTVVGDAFVDATGG